MVKCFHADANRKASGAFDQQLTQTSFVHSLCPRIAFTGQSSQIRGKQLHQNGRPSTTSPVEHIPAAIRPDHSTSFDQLPPDHSTRPNHGEHRFRHRRRIRCAKVRQANPKSDCKDYRTQRRASRLEGQQRDYRIHQDGAEDAVLRSTGHEAAAKRPGENLSSMRFVQGGRRAILPTGPPRMAIEPGR